MLILSALRTLFAVATVVLSIFALPALGILAGTWYVIGQVVSLLATLIGYFILIPICLFHLWTDPVYPGIKTQPAGIMMDKFSLPINFIYGNPEEGVSGKQALVWSVGVNPPVQVPFMPTPSGYGKIRTWLWDAWRAWNWSAWRNSCDQLKYTFGYSKGKLVSKFFTVFGKTFTVGVGWKPENGKMVSVFSWN